MSYAKVADLSIDDFKSLIRETVSQTIFDVLNDSDEGLELREDFSAKLRQSLAEVKIGGKTTPANEAAAKLGLEW